MLRDWLGGRALASCVAFSLAVGFVIDARAQGGEAGQAGDGGQAGDTSSGGASDGGMAGSSGSSGGGASGAGGMRCVPGHELACSCDEGQEGVQICSSDGRGYPACSCFFDGPPSTVEEERRPWPGCGCRLDARSKIGPWGLALALVLLFRRQSRPRGARP